MPLDQFHPFNHRNHQQPGASDDRPLVAIQVRRVENSVQLWHSHRGDQGQGLNDNRPIEGPVGQARTGKDRPVQRFAVKGVNQLNQT